METAATAASVPAADAGRCRGGGDTVPAIPMSRHPLVRHLIADAGHDPEAVSANIHPDDEMLDFDMGAHSQDRDRALVQYFQTGLGILTAMRQLVRWRFGGFEALGSMLDFASGYGRVTRFLIRELPPAKLWISEITPQAVAFQIQEFGIHALLSAHEPRDFRCDRKFDFIFVASLFSHLPPTTFAPWLGRLCELLLPGGMLVFSVHDASLLLPGQPMPASGILFGESSESRSLDPREYGSTWVTENFVRQALASAANGVSCARIARGLCGLQDLYIVLNESGADLSRLPPTTGPEAHFDACALMGRRLTARGWAVEHHPGCKIENIQLFVDEQEIALVRVFHDREDVARHLGDARHTRSGWEIECDIPEAASISYSLLLLKTTSSSGIETVISLGTIGGVLLKTTETELAELKEDVRRTERAFQEYLQEVQSSRGAIATLESRVAAMQASRFWKARERWFRLKRFLRLTDEA